MEALTVVGKDGETVPPFLSMQVRKDPPLSLYPGSQATKQEFSGRTLEQLPFKCPFLGGVRSGQYDWIGFVSTIMMMMMIGAKWEEKDTRPILVILIHSFLNTVDDEPILVGRSFNWEEF